MKKIFYIFVVFNLFIFNLTAQSDEELFGSDDDLFGDDSIEIVEDVKAKSDLSKGVLFETGSIKIGGNFTTKIETSTVLYSEKSNSFGDNLKDTILTPTANAFLLVDARPTQTLRMYTKFGINYPYKISGNIEKSYIPTQPDSVKISDWFSLKELFTDFSIKDTAFFRFGLHTVTWGTGYFFSPVSDMINTSSINPEDTSAQVDGSLNLRTQVTFKNSQNCLWFYVIPSTKFQGQTAQTYAKDTAFAGKFDLVLGSWEFGFGGFYKYQNSPKIMMTATGSLKSYSLFAEAVYSYGGESEWQLNNDWNDKKNIFQATIGFSRFWKDPSIMLAAQYYYDGNNKDLAHKYVTYGHNIAAMANFGRLFKTTDLTLNLFSMVNFGKEELSEQISQMLSQTGFDIGSFINTFTLSAMFNYSPINELSIGLGPYVTFKTFENKPTISLKLSLSLGGEKF